MAPTYSQKGELGSIAPDFTLPGVDGSTYTLSHFSDATGLLMVFMCNHCPYVQAVRSRINDLAKGFSTRGLRVVGINSNDAALYPDDSYEAMKRVAMEEKYLFPYLWDESQEVARAYGAVCTPDFMLYQPDTDGQFVLRYRGRLDDNWKEPQKVQQRDLLIAINAVIQGDVPKMEQIPSVGCSIKWKPQKS